MPAERGRVRAAECAVPAAQLSTQRVAAKNRTSDGLSRSATSP